MSKNYATLYASGNDSISLEQRFYLKEEIVRGTMVYPAITDFFIANPGGNIAYEQPFESSPIRSGRHHSSIIKQKKITNWNFTTFFMVDTSVAAGITELDPALRVLWKSLLGNETVSGGVVYEPSIAPDLSFTTMEVGDKWARQAPGCFVQTGNATLPGDGQATIEWGGMGKTGYLVGLGKSVEDNDGGNDIEVAAGETYRFPVGSAVMLVESDGLTRSADTPDGSPRLVTAVNHGTNIVTIGGAVLADAKGDITPLYICYYEPDDSAIDPINDPQTGLVGSIAVTGLSLSCFRSLSINMNNNHEAIDYCYGTDELGQRLYVPSDRLTTEIALEMNLGDDSIELFNKLVEFATQNITAIVGDAASRHVKFEIPATQFAVPAFTVPDTGSIVLPLSGTALETAFNAGDEVTVRYL